MSRAVAYHVWLELAPAFFTDVTDDVIVNENRKITGQRGISIGTPVSLLADVGTMEFWLRNDSRNGHASGYYSPYNAACRAGFARGIGVKLIAVIDPSGAATQVPMWRGKVRKISPISGPNNALQTYCYCSDVMEDLTDTNVKSLSPQIGKTEVELFQAIFAAMPSDARPIAVSYDTALDTYDYSFYEFGGNAPSAKALLDTVLQNCRGRGFVAADGTWTSVNRHSLSMAASSYSMVGTFQDITVEDGLDNTFNRVQITQHPKRPTAAQLPTAPIIALFSDTSPVAIEPGQTVTLWASYRDPNNTVKLLGAASVVTPLVATTDYVANAASDGSGANLTANISPAGTVGFAADVMFVFTNNAAQVAYLTLRQIRGKGLYDDSPITVQSYTPMAYGDRLLPIDLKYLSSVNIAQDMADFINASFNDPSNQARQIFIMPESSAEKLTQSTSREIGNIVTVTEVVTGLSLATLMILGIRFDIGETPRHWWNVIPSLVQAMWIFDSSRFDIDLIFGYA